VAHSSSAKKRMRQNEAARLRNRRRKADIKDTVRTFTEAVAAGKPDDAAKALREVQKRLDRTADHGTIHKNAAARQKSRLAKKLNKLAAGAK
jgi:small subunit ribosomal protein S20